MEKALFVIGLIRAGLTAAPDVRKFVGEAKEFVSTLVNKDVIPASVQDRVFAHIEELAHAVEVNQPPPEYVVEADPK
jgi:hypothetical protein